MMHMLATVSNFLDELFANLYYDLSFISLKNDSGGATEKQK